MRFTFFRTPTPKEFTYNPRYYDEEKERLEQRKAELGFDSTLSPGESIRLQMKKRWRQGGNNPGATVLSKLIYYTFFGFVIIGGVYVIFFTDMVDKLIMLFGIGK